MRTLLIVLVVVVVLAGAMAWYLGATTPASSQGIRFPLSPAHRELLAWVPADADAFAIIPSAAAVHKKLRSNPITRDALARWNERNTLPEPWMLGAADLVVWKSGHTTNYALKVDPVRAALFRLYQMFAGGSAQINPGSAPGGLALDLELLDGLPPGDALVVQREEERGEFPPIARPAVSSVQIDVDDVSITSRARSGAPVPALSEAGAPSFATGALLSARFARPPRIVGDFNRIFGSGVSSALEHGGSIAIYGIDTGTLLPSPKGVIALPPTPEARQTAQRLAGWAEVRETEDAVLVSFDRTSIDRYMADQFVPARWPSNAWAVRIDAARMIPILDRLSNRPGLRLVTPRIHRSVRDLRGWMGALTGARTIEAAQNRTPTDEELRVRISSK